MDRKRSSKQDVSLAHDVRDFCGLLAGFLVGGFLLAQSTTVAFGEEKVFVIANYPVEARAKNAVAAKKRALADGEKAAFRSLLKRIVPVTAYNQLRRLQTLDTNSVLEGYAVRSEQNSGTEYIASLDFIFSADGVRQTLRTAGVPFIDRQAERTTLVSATLANGNVGKPGQLGMWGKTWKSLDLRNTLTPLEIEPLKSVIHSDAVTALVKGDANAIRIFNSEYKKDRLVVAVSDIDKKSGRLNVALVGRDAVGQINWKRSYRITDGDVEFAMEYAAVVSLGVLEGRWKSRQAADRGGIAAITGLGEEVAIRVQYNNLADWYSIRDILQRTNGVNDLREAGVSARNASVTLRFPGGGNQLATVLASQGFSMTNTGLSWQLQRLY